MTTDCPVSQKQWGLSKVNVTKVIYDWTITDFSLRPENVKQKLTSPEFYSGVNKSEHWKLELYPRGDDEANKEHVSLFLKLISSEKEELSLQCKFSVLKTDTNTKINTKKFYRKFMAGTTLGYPCYITRSHLVSSTNELGRDDTLVVCCEIDISGDTVTTSFVDEAPTKIDRGNRRLVDDLQVMLNDGIHSDCKIIVEDRKFAVHKNILSARSPVFAAMFAHSMKEKETNVVQINDITADVINGMLRFMYTDEIPDLDKSLMEYLAVAEKYEISGLKRKCEEAIRDRLNEQNAAKYLVIADRYNVIELKDKVTEFITKRLPAVVKSMAYKELVDKYPGLLAHIINAQANIMEENMTTE